jgi:competence protein ComEC
VNTVFQQLSYHILSSVALSFILGIASTSLVTPLFFSPTSVVSILCVVFLLTAVLHMFRQKRSVFFLLLFFFFGIGFLHAQIQSVPPAGKNHIWNTIIDQQEAVVVSTLLSMPEYNGRTSKIAVSVKYLRLRDWEIFTPVAGDILLQMEGLWPEQFLPGDTLVLRADLKRPTSFNSPGSFDFSQHLARKDIWITGFIRTPLFIKELSEDSSLFHRLRFFPERIRVAIGREIDTRTPSELSGLYRAILLGDRSGVSETVLEQFKASGTMHILAISGIHMSIIGTLLFGFFYRILSLSETLLLRFNVKKAAALFCLPVLIFYSIIAGFNPPVVRSLIMSTVVIAGLCIDRKKSAGDLLFFAAFLILTFSPLQLFTASFQLSFTAVAAILFILPTLKGLLTNTTENESEQTVIRKMMNWLLAGLLVSVVATLATTPLSLYYFNRISLIGPLANLFLEPLICLWSLSCGVIAIPLLFLFPETGAFSLTLGTYGLDLALMAVNFFSSFSNSNFRLPTPSVWLIFFYYLFLILLAIQAGRKRWLTFGGLALPFAVASILLHNPETFTIARNNRPLTLSFLDVGQGNATFIEYPSGHRLIVDGGGSAYLKKTTVGERVIAPYLWTKGISHINEIIVTHPDADHYNGLPFIAEHFSPSGVWLNTLVSKNVFLKQFLKQLEERGITPRLATDGQELREYPEALHCLANPSLWENSGLAQDSREEGNNGLIVQACANNICILLPGDISKHTEQILVRKKLPLPSNFLLSPHHGSATSNSEQFLQAVNPEYMIVSAGKNRAATFPNPDLSRICDLNNIKLLQTAQHGTIEIVATSRGYQIYGYRKFNDNPLAKLSRFLIAENTTN